MQQKLTDIVHLPVYVVRAAAAAAARRRRAGRPQPDSLVGRSAWVSDPRCVCAYRMFFQPAQSNFGKSEAISYVNPGKFRPTSTSTRSGQQQFSYSQTPRSRQGLRDS
jgi:hypothetical protein